jgi:hypothetical protein
MNETIAPLLQHPTHPALRGGFVSACIVHCQTIFNEGEDRWSAWKIDGVYPREAFANFYFNQSGPTVLLDPLPYPANPSCPVWT